MSKLIVNMGTLSAGGAERVLSILSKPFADAFDEVQYVLWLDSKYPDVFYETDSRVKIVRVSVASGTNKVWRQVLWFRKYVKVQGPDLVLSFMKMIGFVVSLSLFGMGIPQVVSERNDPRYNRSKILRKLITFSYLLPDIKGVVVQTKNAKDYFSFGKIYNKIAVICNPIFVEKEMIGRSLMSKKEDLIVSVGRLARQKRQDILIEAFSLFHKSHPSYKLCIYGEGGSRDFLRDLSKRMGVEDFVFLPGRSDRVLDEICRARMFVMTSAFEGMSNALLEALCIGLPCISTKVNGATDLIRDGETGFLVNVGDIEAIAEKMSFIADNAESSTSIGNAAKSIYDKFSVDVVSNQWISYLKGFI